MIAISAGIITNLNTRLRDEDIEKQLSQSAAGQFALSNLKDCTKPQGLFDNGKPEVECVNTVIAAARNLKGEQFAKDVAQSLNSWTEHAQKSK